MTGAFILLSFSPPSRLCLFPAPQHTAAFAPQCATFVFLFYSSYN
nr:MAG TPA: hypothetical protein [Caudoviricetes sp.]